MCLEQELRLAKQREQQPIEMESPEEQEEERLAGERRSYRLRRPLGGTPPSPGSTERKK
jgi:hypothetical protein